MNARLCCFYVCRLIGLGEERGHSRGARFGRCIMGMWYTLIRSVICNRQSAGWTSSPGVVRLGFEDILMHRAPFMIQK